jgi:imidazolonepropionase-like amidohydrolase
MSILIRGATIVDSERDESLQGHAILVEAGRIARIGRTADIAVGPDTQIIDAPGTFVIPGLMNANVHLLMDIRLENLARYIDRFEDMIIEAAQVALKSGLTTVFDTYGPRRFLMAARDRVDRGEEIGSRIFCAGNIVGFDGPFSEDFNFFAKADSASPAFASRINAIWVENVGRHLMWLTPERVAEEIARYLAKGIDFLKYGSNDHYPGAFLAFSPDVQKAIVDEVHRAGLTAQAHTMSIEGLKVAIEAGCDLIQHANVTGPEPLSEQALHDLAARRTGLVVFPWTERGFEWILDNVSPMERNMWLASDMNARNFITAGANILMANDGAIFAPEKATQTYAGTTWGGAPQDDSLIRLGEGHFVWLRAMEEKGMRARDMLRAATINIAKAYRKDAELGSIAVGKHADLLILDRDPLQSAENYRSIRTVIKAGEVVNLDRLPSRPILTRPMEPAPPEAEEYVPFIRPRGSLPATCPVCARR